jgi:hypothetical protein
MSARWMTGCALLLPLAGLSAGADTPPKLAQQANSPVRAHAPMRVLGVGADGSVVSPNWSGYAVTGEAGAVTSVSGSWIVPAATCGGSDPNYSGTSDWVGIDGYTSATVEQTGTDSDCAKGSPRYYAWYEFYPDPGITITTISVKAGDVVFAAVTYSGTEFTATITDESTQESFTASKAVARAKRNSAEWIAEDNAVNFTNFGTVFFGQDETGISGTCDATVTGKTASIGGFPRLTVHGITMADSNGTVLAVPSPLSTDGTTFSVQWQSAH